MKVNLLKNDNANVYLVMTPAVISALLCDSPVCVLCHYRCVISVTLESPHCSQVHKAWIQLVALSLAAALSLRPAGTCFFYVAALVLFR